MGSVSEIWVHMNLNAMNTELSYMWGDQELGTLDVEAISSLCRLVTSTDHIQCDFSSSSHFPLSGTPPWLWRAFQQSLYL